MLHVKDVWKEYKIDNELTFAALKGVTLDIKDGEFTAITGPSGSGKSTLMHIIGLLDRPSRGLIEIDDRDISKMDDNELSTFRSEVVGFVFQQFNLINKLSVVENVMLPAIYARKKLEYDPREKAMYLIERFGLLGKENSYPNKISGTTAARCYSPFLNNESQDCSCR